VCNTALNISGKSKVVKQRSKFSSFMNQIYFELELCLWVPIVQVELLAFVHLMNFMIFISFRCCLITYWFCVGEFALMHHVNCDRVLLQELSNRIMFTVSYCQHFCWFCLYRCMFEAFAVQVQSYWTYFYNHIGRSYGKLCRVFYLGHFNATRDVVQVRYKLPLQHCMNAMNFSQNHHLYSGTCASGKMMNQIP